MSILKELGYRPIIYSMPERLTADEARRRRVASTLTKYRKALEARPRSLSPANKFHLLKLKEFEQKFSSEIEARKRHVDRLLKSDPSVKSAATKAAMFGYFQLATNRSRLVQKATQERRRNALFGQAIAANRSYFHPAGRERNPRTVYGTEARTKLSRTSRRSFRFPYIAFPCIQRSVRREVMFARGKGGRGYRVPHAFNFLSAIGC